MSRRLSARNLTVALAALCALLAPARGAAQAQTLVPAGSVWRYLDTGADAGTAWTSLAYDDSGWRTGAAQLGYGDGDEVTTVRYGSSSNKYVTTYFRHTFAVADPSAYPHLSLRVLRDDGAVVYLNGVEILRSNMPGGSILSSTLASSALGEPDESAWSTTAIPSSLLVAGLNVLAVEIHQADRSSSDISFDLSLAVGGPGQALVTRGPYLQRGSPTGIVVRWRTDTSTGSYVDYGPAPDNLLWTAGTPAPTTEHSVELAGLQPDTTYYYAIGTGSARLAGADGQHSFVTSPTTGTARPARIWVIGDSGTADASAAAVRNAYQAWTGTQPTDFWLMLGDNAYDDGTNAEFQAAVFDMYPQMLRTSVLWPSIGNHDAVSSRSSTQTGPYFDAFTLPTTGEAGGAASGTEAYYSFDQGNIHVIVLDSSDSSLSATGPMATWLRADLAQNTLPWVIAVVHHSPYAKGSRDSDNDFEMTQIRERFLPILEQGGVDLVLGGHSHDYERSYLIDGHYGYSSTFTAAYVKNGGDGREDGTGAYRKPAGVPHQGTVYAVVGISGAPSQSGSRDHPAMPIGFVTLGSLVIDVNGARLDATLIDHQGVRRDYFTIIKDGSGQPVPQPPAAPTALAAAAQADGSVSLTWVDGAANEEGYELQRAPGSGAFTSIATVGPSVTTFTDTGLTAGTAYSYRVRAFNGAGASAWSNTAQATIPPAAAPVLLIAAGSDWKYLDTGVVPDTNWTSLTFDDSTWASGAAQFGYGDGDERTTIGWGPNPNSKYITTYFRHAFEVGDPAAWSALTLRLLRDDGAVVYLNGREVVRSNMPSGTVTPSTFAVDALGEPEEASWVSASLAPAELVAGTNVLAVEIHQAWIESSDLSFDLELQAEAGGTPPPDPGPDPEPEPEIPPAPPSALTATAVSSATVVLSWQDNANTETGYEVQRAMGTGAYATVATLAPSSSGYTDSGLAAATTYRYRVRALATATVSEWSAIVKVKTAARPNPPTNLTATTPAARTVRLTWEDRSDDETGFQIQRSLNGVTFTSVTKTGADVMAYAVTGLKANTTYYFRVRAFRDGRYSGYSNVVRIKTPK